MLVKENDSLLNCEIRETIKRNESLVKDFQFWDLITTFWQLKYATSWCKTPVKLNIRRGERHLSSLKTIQNERMGKYLKSCISETQLIPLDLVTFVTYLEIMQNLTLQNWIFHWWRSFPNDLFIIFLPSLSYRQQLQEDIDNHRDHHDAVKQTADQLINSTDVDHPYVRDQVEEADKRWEQLQRGQ